MVPPWSKDVISNRATGAEDSQVRCKMRILKQRDANVDDGDDDGDLVADDLTRRKQLHGGGK
jgi:hypothetical protein